MTLTRQTASVSRHKTYMKLAGAWIFIIVVLHATAIDAQVNPHEPPLPPKIKVEQGVKFAESLARGTPYLGGGVRWGSEHVLADTLERVRDAGLRHYRVALEITGIQARVLAAQAGLGVLAAFWPAYAGPATLPGLQPVQIGSDPPSGPEFGLVQRREEPVMRSVTALAAWVRHVTADGEAVEFGAEARGEHAAIAQEVAVSRAQRDEPVDDEHRAREITAREVDAAEVHEPARQHGAARRGGEHLGSPTARLEPGRPG